MRTTVLPIALTLLVGCDSLFGLTELPSPLDAFDAEANCPIDYDLALQPGSRYRVITIMASATTQYDDCADDLMGSTHLVVVSSTDEQDQLQNVVDTRALTKAYVGIIQSRAATTTTEGWMWLTGEPTPPLWHLNEPNDADDNEAGHTEQFAALVMGHVTSLSDVNGSDLYYGLCECDGRPITDEARAVVDSNRP